MAAPRTYEIGQTVRFSYTSPVRGRVHFEGEIVRRRKDRGGPHGWLDVRCRDGVERSVRPNRVEEVR